MRASLLKGKNTKKLLEAKVNEPMSVGILLAPFKQYYKIAAEFACISDMALKASGFPESDQEMEKMPKFLLGSKSIAKNTAQFVGKVLGSGWSESIEEGKQYLNGKAFQDGSYAGESDSIMDSIINDIAGGSRAAYSFVGDMFGVTADRELIANMKGGFLGGFGHTATI